MSYLQTVDEIFAAVEERQKNKKSIRVKLSQWIEQKYGISNYWELMANLLPELNSPKPISVLPRQITSISTEDIAFEVVSRKVGLTPMPFSFTADSFTTKNHDKVGRVKIAWIKRGRKGTITAQNENLTNQSLDQFNRQRLNSIRLSTGELLSSYHEKLASAVFGQNRLTRDASRIHHSLVKAATKKPTEAYLEINHKEERVLTNRISSKTWENDIVRPPSSWYYPLYFSWFLDGSLVMFETYENPLGEVFEAKKLFLRTVDELVGTTGVKPLVVEIPPLSADMLYHNTHIRDGGLPRTYLEESCSGKTIKEMMENVASNINSFSN